METRDFYDWASGVLYSITEELNDSYYKELKGTLTLQFDTTNVVNAQAIVYSAIKEPPKHAISISYKLMKTLYDDAVNFVSYVYSGKDDEVFKFWNAEKNGFSELKEEWDKSECAKNIFLAGLTWVYFHELGHLTQGHSLIRERYGSSMNIISELHSNEISFKDNNASAIWHVTEIAADYFSTCMCVAEITRQLKKRENYAVHIIFLTCGISLMLHRFQGVLRRNPRKFRHSTL
ncbi:hypothetical protein [Pantoea stewartii]|uniref:hypothetical protein n=1 Tax=Pantoea stewartii TaxID=66269 RepID=UPI00345BEFD7